MLEPMKGPAAELKAKDSEGLLACLEERGEGCLARRGCKKRKSDPEYDLWLYYLPVYSASGDRDVPEVILWSFDSRGGNDSKHKGNKPDWVHDSVVAWLEETKSNLTAQYNKTIPSLAFFHIPITAARDFREGPGVDPSREPGINGEPVSFQGYMYNGKSYDQKFMAALSTTNGLQATFSGHDHTNDWCFRWKDTTSAQAADNVGVNILLHQDTLKKEAISWIRLEEEMVTENVTLNATFGQDKYHPLSRHMDLKRSAMAGAADGLHVVPSLYSVALFLFLVAYLPFRF
ncbi:hypothetical protein BO71DRAFT_476350 [Aspergillus ellipticus CBS 707.79]|uniref:Calcineurin-like phosphoesterase domain-containing protein n=1 Tax=Aspergillus ellipticus CBS 707.79 TaxID=1448320 RepID=A0A319DA90_9EURO|nr:hypothetical protein BO71DRAFT_476350 [Aspergillus ellipticus CBS 707.79]